MHNKHVWWIALLAAAACGSEPDETVLEPPAPAFAISILVLSGGGQVDTVGQELPLPIRFVLVDSMSREVPNAAIRATTAGTVRGEMKSDRRGEVELRWTLGTTVGEQGIIVDRVNADSSTTPIGTIKAIAIPAAGNAKLVTGLQKKDL